MSLIGLLVFVIVFGLLAYCVTLLPLPSPWKQIALILVVLIAIIYLCGALGVIGWGPRFYVK